MGCCGWDGMAWAGQDGEDKQLAACCQGNVEPESFVIVDAAINAPESLLIIIKIILVEMIMALVSGMPLPLRRVPASNELCAA